MVAASIQGGERKASEVTRAIVAAMAREISRQRQSATPRSIVTFQIGDPSRGFEVLTIVVYDAVSVLEGQIALPGLPSVTLTLAYADLRGLMAGRANAAELARRGALQVRGDVAILNDLAACFKPSKNWVSIRLG